MVPSIIFPIPLHSCHTTLCKKSHDIVTLDDYESFISKIYHQSVFHAFEIHTSLEFFYGSFSRFLNKQKQTTKKYLSLIDSVPLLSVIKNVFK